MIPRELADLCERAPGFDAETLTLIAYTLRAQANEIEELTSQGVVRAQQVKSLMAEIQRLQAEATALANQSFITIKSWKDMVDGLAAEISALKADRTAVVNTLRMIARFARPHAIREAKRRPSHDSGQVLSSIESAIERHKAEHNFASPWIEDMRSEIDALKAEAIVRGSTKLDEAAKQAQRREAVKAAWERITGGRGWLSCCNDHDPRCAANGIHYTERGCTCGADDFRKLMDG